MGKEGEVITIIKLNNENFKRVEFTKKEDLPGETFEVMPKLSRIGKAQEACQSCRLGSGDVYGAFCSGVKNILNNIATGEVGSIDQFRVNAACHGAPKMEINNSNLVM